MGRKAIDLMGQKFNRLTVLRRDTLKKGNHSYWICQCDCGNICSVRGDNLINGKIQSCGCLQKEIISKQNTIDLMGQKFGYLTVLKRDISKKDNHSYWICQCDCGNIVSVRRDSLINGRTQSCGCYKSSKGEDKIKDILSFLKIDFIQQKTFNNLKYKDNLRFDFFLPEYNICIEYQGQQHYEIVEYFGGKEAFKERKIRDNIKKQWCKENNIKLIEISYTDFDKLNEDYIKSKL